MNKIALIIRREYLSRVKNKTFLLSTFLLPLAFLLFIVGSAYFASKSIISKTKIAVINDPGFIQKNIHSDSSKVLFDFNAAINEKNFSAQGYDGLLILNKDTANRRFKLVSSKTLNTFVKDYIETSLDKVYTSKSLQDIGISQDELEAITQKNKDNSSIDNVVAGENGEEKKVNAGLNSSIGMACGFLIYLTMFVFGAMVMRGVMEEKTNRIAEVMISSVKPFELMMGKIVGIGGVGLTQLLLWGILLFGITSVAQLFIPADLMAQVQHLKNNPAMAGNNTAMASEAARNIYELQTTLSSIQWTKIILCFIFYFIGGYLFYASLFAAVGSVVSDDAQEAQSLMLPLTMPIIFGFIILSTNLNTPDSPAMVWASIIPFTSPIVMMGRIASNPPVWQVALSMAMLVGGFLFTTWLAGKIYRTGILLYGKKPSWKEMLKWAFRKS